MIFLLTRVQSLNCFRALKSYTMKLFFHDTKRIKNKGYILVTIDRTFKKARKARGKKSYAFVLKTKYKLNYNCLSNIQFKKNDSVFLKNRMTPRGKVIIGPIPF